MLSAGRRIDYGTYPSRLKDLRKPSRKMLFAKEDRMTNCEKRMISPTDGDTDKTAAEVKRPRIYFAGSIRGGREDARLYRRLIEYLKKYGDVLTEHVGDPSLMSIEEAETDRYIYERDVSWLRQSDIVIAECTSPSLGVGYELCYAERHEKPAHILYRSSECELSAMLSGDKYFIIHSYETEQEAFGIIDGIFS